MRNLVLSLALVTTLALPAEAKDLVLPAKNPAITLTIPDDWDVSERDSEIVSTSSDGRVTLNVAFDVKSKLDDLIKESKDWLKKSKVGFGMKPTEQVMDFSGTPGRVQRYQTSDKNGKTLVDFVTLDASGSRAVLFTIWGSESERQENDADLAGIMKSVKVPAGTGGGFWAGGASQGGRQDAAKAEPAKSEPAKPAAAAGPATLADLEAQERATADLWARLPYGTRHAMFVTRKAEMYGDYEARPSNVFASGEKLLTYVEPVGYAWKPVGSDTYRFGVTVDFEVLSKDGKVLGGQKALLNQDLSSHYKNREFFLSIAMSLDGISPGDYVLAYTLRDNGGSANTRFEQPFTIKG
ncbi:hypothetical protein [Methylobacterium trifolii]|uniref:DUF1795 domain-containing protein n=1 Tax=Methylobacterium trifolii TaxID=1003092 RepID=A0ABQ4TZ49_9HYPH|nr:hypothetical protein [Methylobacterium trifolii]GJE60524.1 hypothetical protein MPOCJGCO_2637 [Methylobacterium trifolii]